MDKRQSFQHTGLDTEHLSICNKKSNLNLIFCIELTQNGSQTEWKNVKIENV